MTRQRARRGRPGPLSLAILALLASCITLLFAVGQYSLVDLLTRSTIEPMADKVPTPLRLERVESAEGGGWSGVLDDRWHSSDAFAGNFRDEFLKGLEYYLQTRGFVVTSSPEAVLVKVTIDHFEGRKRVHDDGGDLRGTLTLMRDGQVIGKKPLFESLSYRDESDECPAFEKELGIPEVHFSTVLFYRLSLSFYRSIEAGIVDSLENGNPHEPGRESEEGEPQHTPPPARVGEEETGMLTIESTPAEAEIILDGTLIATTPALHLKLPSGHHSLRLRKTGYQDWVREVTVLGGNDLTLKATLEKSTGMKNQ